MRIKLLGGSSSFGYMRILLYKFSGVLFLRASVERSVVGFRDCEDGVLNDRDLVVFEISWNVFLRKVLLGILEGCIG